MFAHCQFAITKSEMNGAEYIVSGKSFVGQSLAKAIDEPGFLVGHVVIDLTFSAQYTLYGISMITKP